MSDYKDNYYPYKCDECDMRWDNIRAAMQCCNGTGFVIKTKIIKKFKPEELGREKR